MRVFISLIFLTFVVTTNPAAAAPQVSTEIEPIRMDQTPISTSPWSKALSPYNYSIYGGYSGGNYFELDKTQSATVLGFRFSVDQDLDHAWDLNIETTSDNYLGLHMGQRLFFDSATDLHPYLKWAAGTHLSASEGLSNFVELTRFQIRGSAGMANLFRWDQHLYFEAGAGLAVVGVEYFLVLGLNFAL